MEQPVNIDDFLAIGLTESTLPVKDKGWDVSFCPVCKAPPLSFPGEFVYWVTASDHQCVIWHKCCWEALGAPEHPKKEKMVLVVEGAMPKSAKSKPKSKSSAKKKSQRKSQRLPDWLEFFGLKPWTLPLNLPQQAADFYILEFCATVLGYGRIRYEEFASWLAELYAKYLLAACLGEFRHRTAKMLAPKLIAVGRDTRRGVAQGRAKRIWRRGREVTATAFEQLAEGFNHPSWTLKGSSFGGPRWATIASIGGFYMRGRIPPGVFIDSVYNIVHNGGRLFDKIKEHEHPSLANGLGLFRYEADLRRLLKYKAKAGLEALLPSASLEVARLYERALRYHSRREGY